MGIFLSLVNPLPLLSVSLVWSESKSPGPQGMKN